MPKNFNLLIYQTKQSVLLRSLQQFRAQNKLAEALHTSFASIYNSQPESYTYYELDEDFHLLMLKCMVIAEISLPD